MVGETLGHFKITGELGKGGMGEVYRATDSRLNREVAVKVLPPTLADDAERMARFAREAQVLASFNDPRIAAVYGLEQAGGHHALIMELVEGQNLAERLAQGPIPLEQALQLALQVALGLEAAHDRGIIHRDLKPANVMLTPDGNVKLLDFGLAKALEGDPAGPGSSPGMAHSPTITAAMTSVGTLLGTAAYMSPEQARGHAADRRADIWSFGVVLMEMITGKTVYQADTISDTLAGVLAREPEWNALPDSLPRPIRNLLKRCLDKDLKQRLQAIGEARIVIEQYLADPTGAATAEESTTAGVTAAAAAPRRNLLPWLVAAAAIAALVLQFFLGGEATPAREPVWASIPAPPDTQFQLSSATPGPVTVSPDGRMLAFSARGESGQALLYVRALEDMEARPLAGTDGAQYPFWSPDSRWIGFFTRVDGTLKKIDVGGSPPLTLCRAENGKGGSWSEAGMILFTPSHNSPIHRVAAAGGESTPVTEIDREQNEDSHRHPRFLPDGEHFLYLARVQGGSKNNKVTIGSLRGGTPKVVLNSAYGASYAAGRLLFVRDGTLLAQPFDPNTLELSGEALPIVQDVMNLPSGTGAAVFSAAERTLAFLTGSVATDVALEWRERDGRVSGSVGELGSYSHVSLSPDGKLAAVTMRDSGDDSYDIWIYELERDLRTRFTFDPSDDLFPTWSPDGAELYFASNRNGRFDIYRKPLGGSREVELVLEDDQEKFPTDCSPDGRHLLFFAFGVDTVEDLYVLPLDGERVPRALQKTEYSEGAAVFSPDGQRVAYWSTESGRGEVYVMRFPEWQQRFQVSTHSGTWSEWRANELLLQQVDGMIVAVPVEPRGETLTVGRPTQLFDQLGPDILGRSFSFAPDGRRALAVPGAAARESTRLTLVLNWTEFLQRR